MYTTKVLSKSIQRNKHNISIGVEFNDAKNPAFIEKIDIPLSGSWNDVKLKIKRKLDQLTAADATITTIKTGIVDVSNLVEMPTTAEIARQEWFTKWARLQQVQQLINHEVLTGVEKHVTDMRQEVKDEFRPVYVNYM